MRKDKDALTIKQSRRLERVPRPLCGALKKAFNGKSKAMAIKLKCCECFGYEDYINGIKNCLSDDCPLWAVRPYKKQGVTNENQ